MNDNFLRISKGCIINITQVKSFDVGENRNMMRPNIFRDIPRKFSAKRSVGMKNTYKLSNDHRIGLNRNSLGSFSDVEFPAINSYFHS